MKISIRLLIALFSFSFVSLPAYATNGSFLIGVGAKSRSMGGVNIAYSEDGLASAFNPAHLVDLGTRVDVGVMFFNPRRSAWVPGFSGRDEIDSGTTMFLLPNMGGAMKFNRKMSIGFAGVPVGGGSTRYNENFFDFSGEPEPTVGVFLAQMQLAPGIAYKVSKTQSIGASLLIGIQQFRAYGVTAFGDAGFSSDQENLSNRGNDYSYGAGVRLGWRGKFFNEYLTLGVTANSKVYMTKFDKYKGLFADEGSFDMPETVGVGLAFKPTNKTTIAFDYSHIYYSGIKAISNKGPTQFLPLPPAERLLGQQQGLGFGWDDMDIYKLGIKYDWNSKWSAMAGYNYAKSPISDDQILFNTLAPAIVEHHITLGATYRPSKKLEFTISGMHAFKNQHVAFNEFSGDNVRLSMSQYAIDFSIGYKLF